MIPESQKGSLEDIDIIITFSPQVRLSRKGKLLDCKLATFGQRLGSVLGHPGKLFAKVVADQLNWYMSSPEEEGHAEFRHRVTIWGNAAGDTAEQFGNGVGQQLSAYATSAKPITTPKIEPPPPPEPEMPEDSEFFRAISNSSKAPHRWYRYKTRICGPGFLVDPGLNVWWGDSQGCVSKDQGLFFPTRNMKRYGPGTYFRKYSGFYCGDWGTVYLKEKERFRITDHGWFTTGKGHIFLELYKDEWVYGPGAVVNTGHLYFIDKDITVHTNVIFMPVR